MFAAVSLSDRAKRALRSADSDRRASRRGTESVAWVRISVPGCSRRLVRVHAARRRLPSARATCPAASEQFDERPHNRPSADRWSARKKIHRPRVSPEPPARSSSVWPSSRNPSAKSCVCFRPIGSRSGSRVRSAGETVRSNRRAAAPKDRAAPNDWPSAAQYIQRPRIALGMDRHIHEVLARRRAGGDKKTETIFD